MLSVPRFPAAQSLSAGGLFSARSPEGKPAPPPPVCGGGGPKHDGHIWPLPGQTADALGQKTPDIGTPQRTAGRGSNSQTFESRCGAVGDGLGAYGKNAIGRPGGTAAPRRFCSVAGVGIKDKLVTAISDATGRAQSPATGQGRQVPDITGAGELELVGESFCRDAHMQLWGREVGRKGARVALIREPTNPADRNAIAVGVVDADGATRRRVGYIDRDTAAEMAARLDRAGGVAVCGAKFGRDDPSHVWRVVLYIDLNAL